MPIRSRRNRETKNQGNFLNRNVSGWVVALIFILLAGVSYLIFSQSKTPLHSPPPQTVTVITPPKNKGTATQNSGKKATSPPKTTQPQNTNQTVLQGERQLILPDGSAQPLTDQAALADLSQQRVANGLPSIQQDIQSYAAHWCPNEDKGSYQGELARNLSGYTMWDTTMTPWDSAPAHQFSFYNPAFGNAGEVDVAGQACLGLGNLLIPPSAPRLFAYISDTGPSLVPPSETVINEQPYAPQQYVGIPEGVPTGPQIFVYALGFPGQKEDTNQSNTAMTIISDSITQNGHPVSDVRLFDYEVALHAIPQSAFGYDDGAILIPPPLKENTTYEVNVLWQGPTGLRKDQTFSFTTALNPNLSLTGQGFTVTAHTASPQPMQLSVSGKPYTNVTQTTISPGQSKEFPITYNTTFTFCFYQTPGQGYSTARECTSITWTGNIPHPHATVTLDG